VNISVSFVRKKFSKIVAVQECDATDDDKNC